MKVSCVAWLAITNLCNVSAWVNFNGRKCEQFRNLKEIVSSMCALLNMCLLSETGNPGSFLLNSL